MPEVAAIAAVASFAYSVHAGERQAGAARRGLGLQRQAQEEARQKAIRDQQQADEAERKAQQRAPNLDVLLSNDLPKPDNKTVDIDRLLLGKPGLLGY